MANNDLNFEELDQAVNNYMQNKSTTSSAPTEPAPAPTPSPHVLPSPGQDQIASESSPSEPASFVSQPQPPAATSNQPAQSRVQVQSRQTMPDRGTSAARSTTFHDIAPPNRSSATVSKRLTPLNVNSPQDQPSPISDVAPPPQRSTNETSSESQSSEISQNVDVDKTATLPQPQVTQMDDTTTLASTKEASDMAVPAASSVPESPSSPAMTPSEPTVRDTGGFTPSTIESQNENVPETEAKILTGDEDKSESPLLSSAQNDISDALKEDLTREEPLSPKPAGTADFEAPASESPTPVSSDTADMVETTESTAPSSEATQFSPDVAAKPRSTGLDLIEEPSPVETQQARETESAPAPGQSSSTSMLGSGPHHEMLGADHQTNQGVIFDDQPTQGQKPMQVFDTKQYHAPIAADHPSGDRGKVWMWIIIFLLVVALAIGAFIVYRIFFAVAI